MQNRIKVTIAEQEYTFLATEEQDYMEQVAAYVDAKICETIQMGSKMSLLDGAVLTAMNLADDHFKDMAAGENLRRQVKEALEEAAKLKMELSEARREIFRLQNNRKTMESKAAHAVKAAKAAQAKNAQAAQAAPIAPSVQVVQEAVEAAFSAVQAAQAAQMAEQKSAAEEPAPIVAEPAAVPAAEPVKEPAEEPVKEAVKEPEAAPAAEPAVKVEPVPAQEAEA